jgi:hypothetical protein
MFGDIWTTVGDNLNLSAKMATSIWSMPIVFSLCHVGLTFALDANMGVMNIVARVGAFWNDVGGGLYRRYKNGPLCKKHRARMFKRGQNIYRVNILR